MTDTDQDQGSAKPADNAGAASNSAEPDLDALIADWDAKKEPSQPKASPDFGALLKRIEPLAKYVETDMQEKQAATVKKITDEAVSYIKGTDALKELDNDLVHDHLIGLYNRDQTFRTAYEKLTDDPSGWNKALEGARDSLQKKIESISGKSLRSDLEAAKAAVSGSSDKQGDEGPSAAELTEMSDAEFRKYKQGLGA